MELDQNSKKDTSALCMKNHYKLNDEPKKQTEHDESEEGIEDEGC